MTHHTSWRYSTGEWVSHTCLDARELHLSLVVCGDHLVVAQYKPIAKAKALSTLCTFATFDAA